MRVIPAGGAAACATAHGSDDEERLRTADHFTDLLDRHFGGMAVSFWLAGIQARTSGNRTGAYKLFAGGQ